MRERRTIVGAGIAIAAIAVVAYSLSRPPAGQPDSSTFWSEPNAGEKEDGKFAAAGLLQSPESIKRVARAVRHRDPAVACRALHAILAAWELDKAPLPPAVSDSLQLAMEGDSRPPVQAALIEILGATTPLGPDGQAGAEAPKFLLDKLQGNAAPMVRAAAARALGKMRYHPALVPLVEAMDDKCPEVAGAAHEAVRAIVGEPKLLPRDLETLPWDRWQRRGLGDYPRGPRRPYRR